MTGKGGMDKVKGKAKEAAAKMTGNRRRATEGRAGQLRGEAEKARSKAEERARGSDPSTPPDPV